MRERQHTHTHKQRQEADISTNKLPSNRPVREQLKSCNCRRRVRLRRRRRRRRRRVLHGWLNCCLCQPVVLPVDCCQLPVVSVAARSANTNSTYLFTYPHLPLPPHLQLRPLLPVRIPWHVARHLLDLDLSFEFRFEFQF